MPVVPITLGRIVRTSVTRSFVFTETAHRAGAVLQVHAHERPAISYVIDGRRTYRFGARAIDAVAGAIVFVPAGSEHASRFGGEQARGLMIEMRAEPDRPLREPLRRLDLASTHACDAILRELRQPDVLTPLALDSLTFDLAADDRRRGDEPALPWLRRVRDALHDDLLHPLSLGAMAAAAGVGRSRLTRAFRHAFGMSIGEYARSVRTQRAWRLVACSEAPLSEVALSCGFADQSHLTRVFRRAFAISPGELRRRGTPRMFKTRKSSRE